MPRKMPVPTDVGGPTETHLTILWSDGHRSTYSWAQLRLSCPCARCKGEWNVRPPQLTAADIPPTIRAMSVGRIGAYALRFVWSDGHDTGIYPFPLLRYQLCECAQCLADRGGQSAPAREQE